jgi:hypothetical protein
MAMPTWRGSPPWPASGCALRHGHADAYRTAPGSVLPRGSDDAHAVQGQDALSSAPRRSTHKQGYARMRHKFLQHRSIGSSRQRNKFWANNSIHMSGNCFRAYAHTVSIEYGLKPIKPSVRPLTPAQSDSLRFEFVNKINPAKTSDGLDSFKPKCTRAYSHPVRPSPSQPPGDHSPIKII